MGDGGKLVCGMSRYEKNTRPCILYSFGVQNESSFDIEEEMLGRTNCEIWGYDFSVDAFGPAIQDKYVSGTHFLRAVISGVTNAATKLPSYNIQDLMAMKGHDHIYILKIDVEFAEFASLSSLNKYTINEDEEFPIGQMLIELHLFNSQDIKLLEFLGWWEILEGRGMRPVWTEPNLLSVTLGIEDRFPRLAEYSLVNVRMEGMSCLDRRLGGGVIVMWSRGVWE